MTKESELLMDIWDIFRDSIPSKKRHDLAVSLIRKLNDYGMDESDLHHVMHEEHYLTDAFTEVFDIEDDEDEYQDIDDELEDY